MGHRRTGTRCTKLYWGLAVKEERRKLSIGKFENGGIRKCAIYYHLSSGFFLIRFVCENPVFSFPYVAFGIRTFAALGLCERKHIQFLEQIVRPGPTAIDVGANCGVYAVALSQRLGKEINDAVLADRTHALPALTREAEGVRFELTRPFSLPVFKTGAINRSATPPFTPLKTLLS